MFSGRGWRLLRRSLQFFLCNLKCRVGRGNTRIDRHLKERLFYIATFKTILQPGANMQTKFLPSPESSCYSQHQQPPRAMVESRTRPDAAPGIAGNQLLKVSSEISSAGHGSVNVLCSEHMETYLHTFLKRILLALLWQQKIQ